jgi:hypothetical protein
MQTKFGGDMGQIQKMLESLILPRNIQALVDASISTTETKRLMEQHVPNEYVSRLGLQNELFQRAAGLTSQNEAMLKAAGIDSISNIAKHYEQHLRPISMQEEMLKMLQHKAYADLSAVDFARQLQEANPIFQAIAAAKKSMEPLWLTLRDIDFSQLEVSEEEEQETKQATESITQVAIQQESLHAVIEIIVNKLLTQQKPTVQLMLWLYFSKLIELLITSALSTVMTHYAPSLLGESPQAAKKEVQEKARAAVGSPQLLMEYRYVSAKVLIVRQNPRASSPEIGRLSFGKPVKLQKKEKDFALVLWTDEEGGAEIQGWVFSRYLGKFN